ncbi:MAG: transglycosylase domain-containing protein [Bacteroidales bacterium]|jgi:penicillin-binding protein 1A
MKKKRKKNTSIAKNRLIRWILYLGFAGTGILLLFIFMVYIGLFGSIPNEKELSKVSNYTASEIYSADRVLLGRYYVENRTNTDIGEIPGFFLDALIATEDARFYNHHGVDSRSTFRVLIKSILLFNKSSGGGSTITQQLAKNLYPRKQLGVLTLPVAKIKEIIIAGRLEKVYTKSEILQLYLNTVPFGENTYGVETAALIFFDKKTSELLPQESAMLVGMLKGNTSYNPRNNYEAASSRRNTVLNQMVKYGYITKEEAERLKETPIKIYYHPLQHDEGPAPYFREYLRQELIKWSDENPRPDGSKYNIYTDGLKIYTTIDYRLQSYAESAVASHMARLQKEFDAHWRGHEPWKKDPGLAEKEIMESARYKKLASKKLERQAILDLLKKEHDTRIFTWNGEKKMTMSPLDSVLHHFALLQTGMISVESKTGFVKAWVGGINYKYFKYDHVSSYRQAGSTFKPIVYAAALETGISPCDFYANDSIVYTDYQDWVPRNADRNYGGYYSVKGALTHSVNTVSAKLIMEAGIKNIIRLAKNMGFEGELPEVPSLALGSGDVSLLELVQAYSAFINKGYEITPVTIRRIEDQLGNVLFTSGPVISQDSVLSRQTANTMLAMLRNVVNQGTASSLRTVYGFQNDIAGKTGTTQNQTDGWFVGITPDLITGVWVGGDNPVVRFRSIRYGQGSYMALPIFAGYMQKVYSDPVYGPSIRSSFNIPEDISNSLDCDDYREKEFEDILDLLEKTEESIGDFIKRIFGRKKDKKEKRNKTR